MTKNDQRKAAPVCETESGSGQVYFEGFDPSEADFTIDFQPGQGTIAFLLSKGRNNARTTRELSRISGLHPRDITKAIQHERLHGAPILSDTGGFWLAETSTEVLQCARQLHQRAGEIHRTARALQKIAKGGARV